MILVFHVRSGTFVVVAKRGGSFRRQKGQGLADTERQNRLDRSRRSFAAFKRLNFDARFTAR
jgi:hypothetical protein